ncbi:MAG: D-alanyl-D-alanine carboxypeptidase family protein [Candidatus Neomarinimicrobiota bacterium]
MLYPVLLLLLLPLSQPQTNSAAHLLGHFRPDTTTGFVLLPERLSGDRHMWLRDEAANDLERLVAAAENDGVWLWVVSATRTYKRQKVLWEGRFNGTRRTGGRNMAVDIPDETERCRELLRYSAPPGLSRHHWGTDVDLNSVKSAYWETDAGLRALAWLQANADRFGYVMAYPPGRDSGAGYEPWHWSYAPLAGPLWREFERYVTDDDIAGFAGAAQVRRLGWRKYVNGVNDALK